MKSAFYSSFCALLLGAGCVGAEPDAPARADVTGGKADQISGRDDPSGILSSADRRLASLVASAEVGQSFGVDDDKIPYPDTYWPMIDNGIAVEWLEKDGRHCSSTNACSDPQPSPLAKWVAMTQPTRVQDAVDWEIKHHGKDVPDVAEWFGHCPGWAAGATLYGPVTGPLSVKMSGSSLVKCQLDDPECTRFEIGDVNALTAEAHEGARSRFIGSRCDTDPADIERDAFGRIVRKGKGCQGLNAGAMLILVGNRLKSDKLPFVIDAQNESNTGEIWNQPAFRYTLNRFETLSESEAANLVATGGDARTGTQDDYLWNDSANGFAFVDLTLHWVTETHRANTTVVSGASSSRTTRMVAVIELDRDASDAEARVIGGEYLDDSRVGASRLRVAPFAWVALDVGSDFNHNPFVRGSQVKSLLGLALSDDDGGASECAHSMCSEGGVLEASCDSCVADICAADPFCCQSSWDSLCVRQVESVCNQSCN